MTQTVTLTARTGKAFRLTSGQTIRIINTHGRQVVDTWAFREGGMSEFMSMEHARVHMGRVNPIAGTVLLSNRPGLNTGILFLDVSPVAFSKSHTPFEGLSGHDTIKSKSPSSSASHGIGQAHSPTPKSTTKPGWLYRSGSSSSALAMQAKAKMVSQYGSNMSLQ